MKKIINTLAISEHFLSIQGEGQTAGRPAYFLRLTGCNLSCGGIGTIKDGQLHNGATWRCDSIEVWMKGFRKTFPEIIQMLGGEQFVEDTRKGDAHLIITGGEPMSQQDEVLNFLTYIQLAHGYLPVVEIETNGTIMPRIELAQKISFWNVSPKLENSGEKLGRRFHADVIEYFSSIGPRTIFKFVISSEKDVDEIFDTYKNHIKDANQIWLMPGADNREQLNAVSLIVAKICIFYKFNMSGRLQVAIWDKTTGV